MFPVDFGNSTYQRTVSPQQCAHAVDSLVKLLRHLPYRGIFSAEFKRDERDGAFRLLDLNARPWWYVDFAARCGVDTVYYAYRDALGLPVHDVTGYRVGSACVYPYHDYGACRALASGGKLRLLAHMISWLGASQPVFRWSDPRPAVGAVLALLRRRFARRS
jgi:D-aspartate ligase